MSISSALSNALSGLNASARAADVVASNLANINTDGYGRRDLELAPNLPGTSGGVRVLGVTRHVDQGVLGDRRLADAALAHAQTRSAFLARTGSAIGTPDQEGALTARIAALETSLVTAASRPDAPERLLDVAQRAADVARGLNGISKDIQSARMQAEQEIGIAVGTLNASLEEVRNLNLAIGEATRNRRDASGLLDQRQVAIDRIAAIVPVQEIPREAGTVALVTPTGAILLDGRAAEVTFERRSIVAPHMRLENGLLSGPMVDGQPASASGPLAGGRLAALFEIRDDLAVTAQARVDGLALDLAQRFRQPGLDPTLGAADPGLFTDAGALVDPAAEMGLAGRLSLNPLADPAAGGGAWRLREGLGATASGATGNATLLNGYLDAMAARQAMASTDYGGVAASLAGHAGALASFAAQDRLTGDGALSFASTRQVGLQTLILQDGVDSDAETQRLLLIEQAYGANARMIQTLDEMMQTLLRI